MASGARRRGDRAGRAPVVVATALAAALTLGACTPDPEPEPDPGSEIVVATSGVWTSGNSRTAVGGTGVSAAVHAAVHDGFLAPSDGGEPEFDDDFGSVDVQSDDPLEVRYTVSADTAWHDGVAVDAADLALAWVAGSGALDGGAVDFRDSATAGLDLVDRVPEFGRDGRSATLTWSAPFGDWQRAFDVGLPAHVVGRMAFGDDDPDAAKQAVLDAIEGNDREALARIADAWNDGFDSGSSPTPDDLVGTGPFRIAAVQGGTVELEAVRDGSSSRQAGVDRVLVRSGLAPGDAVGLFAAGEADVVSTQATLESAQALLGVADATILAGAQRGYEHVDLDVTDGAFVDERVRRAFLSIVPRADIVDELVAPLQEEALPRDSQVFSPDDPAYEAAVASNGSLAYRQPDAEVARTLLAEAGQQRPEICVLYDPRNERRTAEFALVQASAAEAGFVVTDCGDEDWRERLADPTSWDAALVSSSFDDDSVAGPRSVFTTDGPRNVGGWSDPELDELFAEASAADTDVARALALTEADARIWANAWSAPLFQVPQLAAVRTDVEGATLAPTAAGVTWDMAAWRLASD